MRRCNAASGIFSLPHDRVLQRLVQIEVRDRVAELVRLGIVVPHLAGALEFGRVLARHVLLCRGEQLFERLILHPADAARRDPDAAFLVFFEVAFLDEHAQDIVVGFVHALELAQDVVAVLEQKLGQLVERRVGRQRLELLRAVPAGKFEEWHIEVDYPPVRPNTTTVTSSCGLRPAA